MLDVTQAAPITDDLVAAFQLEGEPVRGRIARLGPMVDDVLTRHAYPEPVANLVGEACALAALVGASLKFEGRLILQAQGDGPVSFVVADYDTTGAIRGYCSYDAERVAEASKGFVRPGAKSLLGKKGVAYDEIDVMMDTKAMNEMQEKSGGARTVPQIFIGDTHVGGSDDLAALEHDGKLDALLA